MTETEPVSRLSAGRLNADYDYLLIDANASAEWHHGQGPMDEVCISNCAFRGGNR